MADLPDKPWFRPGEAAKLLGGISLNTLRKYLPRDCPRSPGGERRIPKSLLETLLKSTQV